MAREDPFKAYMDAYWQYRNAIGHVDAPILSGLEVRLHELWQHLDKPQRLLAFKHMALMVRS